MIFRRSRVLLGSSLLALSMLLTACSPSGSAPTASGETTKLEMWGVQTKPLADILPGSVERWNSSQSAAAIDLELFPSDEYKTKIRTAVGAGQAPNFIFGWGGGILRSYVDAGEVVDLTSYLDANPTLRDRYLPSVLANGVLDGKQYAIPANNAQPVVLFINTEVFAKVGAQPPKTWDDLLALVPVFRQAGIAPISLAGQSRWPGLMWLEYLVDRIGGPEVFEKIVKNEPNAWSDPAVLQSLGMIQELVEAGGFQDGFESVAANAEGDQALLYTGKAAMMMQIGSMYASLKASAPDWVKSGGLGYITFPAVTGGRGDPANVVGNPSNFWSLSARSSQAQIDAAVGYFTDEMFSEKYIGELIDAGSVPVVKGIEEKLAASSDASYLTMVYELLVNAPNFQLSWDQALSPEQSEAMLTNLDLIFLGEIKPEQFVATMNATITK